METGSLQYCGDKDTSERRCHSSSDHVPKLMQGRANDQHALTTTLGHAVMERSSYLTASLKPPVPVIHSSSIPIQDGEWFCSSHAQTKTPAVVHPVPNIMVEHVSLSSVDHSMPSLRLKDVSQLRSSLSELSSAMQSGAVSRQSRALSDSSMWDLERSLYRSSSHHTERYLSDSLDSSTTSLNVGVVTDISLKSTKTDIMQSLVAQIALSEDSLTRQVDESRLSVPSIATAVIQPCDASSTHLRLPRFCGPQKSPKAYWLRRHSDSNLESGQVGNGRSRVEPYPIRSHSTGNSFMASAIPISSPSSSPIICDYSRVTMEEQSVSMKPSMRSHPLRDAQQLVEGPPYRSADEPEQKSYHSSYASVEPESSIQSQLKGINLANDLASSWQDSSRRKSQTYQMAVVSEDNKVNESTLLEGSSSDLVHSTVIKEKTVPVEKRLKLKKYLQTRYQLSQRDGFLLSSESDDVFVDRFASPGPLTPLLEHANRSAAPDLVLINNNRPSSDSNADFQCLGSNSSSYAVSNLLNQPGSNSHLCELLQSSRTHSDSGSSSRVNAPLFDNFSIKEEPRSPRVIPRGTSVFVFPPPPLMQIEDVFHGSPQSVLPFQKSHAGLKKTSSTLQNSPGLSTSRAIGSCVDYGCSHTHNPVSISESLNKGCESDGQSTLPMECGFSTVASDVARDSPVLEESCNEIMKIPVTSFASVLIKYPVECSGVETSHATSMLRMTHSFVCPLCSVGFQSCGNLTDHMAVHLTKTSSPAEAATGSEMCAGSSKPVHLCPICQRTFSRGDMLTRHVRLHTGVRPYECTLCSQVFSRSDHLTTHQRTHTGEKPYRCPVCAYAAPRRDMVTRHVRIHETQTGSAAAHTRRGRKAVTGHVPDVAAFARVPLKMDTINPVNFNQLHRRRSEYATQQSQSSTIDGECSGDDHRNSISNNIESADCSRSLVPVTCRAWSMASAESFESFPGSDTRGTSLSSATADSPDVFLHLSRNFRWGPEAHNSSLSEDTVAAEVAGVTPVFQKCSVTTPPLLRNHSSDIGDAN